LYQPIRFDEKSGLAEAADFVTDQKKASDGDDIWLNGNLELLKECVQK